MISEGKIQQLLLIAIEWYGTECQCYYLTEKEEKVNIRITIQKPTISSLLFSSST